MPTRIPGAHGSSLTRRIVGKHLGQPPLAGDGPRGCPSGGCPKWWPEGGLGQRDLSGRGARTSFVTRIAVLSAVFVLLAAGFSTDAAAPDGNRFQTSRTFHLGAGHAVRTFTLAERDGVILLNRLTVRHGVRARVDARIPGVAGARVVSGGACDDPSLSCRRRGAYDLYTQGEEWCPMPAATWHVRLVKFSGPAGRIRFDYVVAPPPKSP